MPSNYTNAEVEVATCQARAHFLRRQGVIPSVAAIIAVRPKEDGWKLMRQANGEAYVDKKVGYLTAKRLRWNRGGIANYLRR